MNILLVNDDGIDSNGLRTLWEGLKGIANLSIVAPEKEQSGVGVSVTFDGPLRAEKVSHFDPSSSWKVRGTPADCVKVALGGLVDPRPDLIVSGINHGSNAGRGIFSSGTVGGVIQGILQGVSGIAFSYTCPISDSFPHVTPYIAPIVQYVIDHPLPQGTFLNVNFPTEKIKGIRFARQGLSFWLEAIRKKPHPEGHLEFHFDALISSQVEHPESDIALLKEGFITAVPLQVSELTDHTHLADYKDHFEKHVSFI